ISITDTGDGVNISNDTNLSDCTDPVKQQQKKKPQSSHRKTQRPRNTTEFRDYKAELSQYPQYSEAISECCHAGE
ncbi:uncharacterized, partial [Tachysurus ichikawai]